MLHNLQAHFSPRTQNSPEFRSTYSHRERRRAETYQSLSTTCDRFYDLKVGRSIDRLTDRVLPASHPSSLPLNHPGRR